MVVLDNIIFSLQRAGGISGAWARLIAELLKSPRSGELMFVERPDATRNIFRRELALPEDKIIHAGRLPLHLDRYRGVRLPKEITERPFIFHSSYYRSAASPLALNVVTLHDFIYERTRFRSPLATAIHHRQKMHALRRARAVACVSRSTQAELHRRLPGARSVVIPNAPVITPPPASDADKQDYALYVGSRASYKRFWEAAQAVAMHPGLRLKIAGSPLSPGEKERLAALLPGRYDLVAHPGATELAELYAHARCLVYPSSAEGFGIPILEAQASGCPVIIGSDAACLGTAGGAAISVDASPASIAEAISQLPDRDMAGAGRRNAARYRWPDIAARYLDLYASLL